MTDPNMKFQKIANQDESEMIEIVKTSTSVDPKPLDPKIPTKTLNEEDPSSLWQYCIHRQGEAQLFGFSLTINLTFFYICCFYAVIAQLVDMSPVALTPTKKLSNDYVIWISKIFFLIFLLVQAESECIDGWRMAKFAQGTRKTNLIFGCLQFFFGCLVEFISYLLIHRSNTIFQIMSYSACLTVFLRIDDVFVSWMTKMFPKTKKKVTYDKGAFEKDPRTELVVSLVIKIIIFIVLEVLELGSHEWYI